MKSPKKVSRKKRPRKGINTIPKKHFTHTQHSSESAKQNGGVIEMKINDPKQIKDSENTKPTTIEESYKSASSSNDELSKTDLTRNGGSVKIDSFKNEESEKKDPTDIDETQST